MAERKTPNKGYQKLKSDLSAGNIGQVYIFYGEESYLREYYLGEIKKKLVPAGFEEFNYHRLSGKTLTADDAGAERGGRGDADDGRAHAHRGNGL